MTLSGIQRGIVWKANNNIEGNNRGITDNNKDDDDVGRCSNCYNHHKDQSKLFRIFQYRSSIPQVPLISIFLLFNPWLIIYSAHNKIICKRKRLFIIHTKPKYVYLLSLPPKFHREHNNTGITCNTRRHYIQYQLQFLTIARHSREKNFIACCGWELLYI